jgi:hypothetical protein
MLSKQPTWLLILWSLLWAFSVIAAAFFFRARPASVWVEAAVNVVGILVFLVLNSRRRACAS